MADAVALAMSVSEATALSLKRCLHVSGARCDRIVFAAASCDRRIVAADRERRIVFAAPRGRRIVAVARLDVCKRLGQTLLVPLNKPRDGRWQLEEFPPLRCPARLGHH